MESTNVGSVCRSAQSISLKVRSLLLSNKIKANIPCTLEPDEFSKESRKNSARLIKKIYEVDPLTRPRCSGKMKVISVVEDEEVKKKIIILSNREI
jgi:hypothetical protein